MQQLHYSVRFGFKHLHGAVKINGLANMHSGPSDSRLITNKSPQALGTRIHVQLSSVLPRERGGGGREAGSKDTESAVTVH